ncbi:hypothetical protein ACTZWY_12195, partial [Roseinatronobacter sp. NSM]
PEKIEAMHGNSSKLCYKQLKNNENKFGKNIRPFHPVRPAAPFGRRWVIPQARGPTPTPYL